MPLSRSARSTVITCPRGRAASARVAWLIRALPALCMFGWALAPPSDARAACSPGSGLATPGTTVTCTGTTINQDAGFPDSFGYGTGTQTGVTINLLPTGAQPNPDEDEETEGVAA